ncbi:hypothetical protein HYALB_00000770 [Hymenoscyphus albidus]|uniref:Secreted protein n=1 Tax=Hymenoscyphus albidus TaxID=595503 RepID=A0A9N9LPH8_9HELO|nr:hypothetical protein HYALB_00000770 [Hymenoscyphus albidus]
MFIFLFRPLPSFAIAAYIVAYAKEIGRGTWIATKGCRGVDSAALVAPRGDAAWTSGFDSNAPECPERSRPLPDTAMKTKKTTVVEDVARSAPKTISNLEVLASYSLSQKKVSYRSLALLSAR